MIGLWVFRLERARSTGYRLQATGYRLQATGYRLQEDGLLILIPHSDYENRHHRVSNLSQAGRICLDADKFAQEINLVIDGRLGAALQTTRYAWR